MRPRTLAALTVVLLLAGALAVSQMWTTRPRTVHPPALASPPDPASRLPSSDPAAPSAERVSGARPAGPRIVVDVTGAVRDPGIHELESGARVDDALRAAGGVRPGTDTGGLNRARLLADGEQLVVGEGHPAEPGVTGPSDPGAVPGARVSVNAATAEQLETLPGIGPALAQRIIEYRGAHGGFSTTDELREVNGIGERRFAELQSRISP